MANSALKFFHRYLIYSTPLALLVMLNGQLFPRMIPLHTIGDDLFSTVFGFLLLLWLVSLVVFLLKLLISENYRSDCFVRLAGIKERDERDELIVGKAAKSSFLLTLSVLLILFFVSTWRFGAQPAEDKTVHSLTIGHLNLSELSSVTDNVSGKVLSPIPASKTAVLLLIIFIQVGSFRYFSQKADNDS